MNDHDLKKIIKSLRYEEPSLLQIAHWKRAVRETMRMQTPGEWTRLAVACLVGIVIGATAFKDKKVNTERADEDATIERVYINLD